MKKLISIVLIAITALSALVIPVTANAAKTKTYKSGAWKYTISGNHAKIVKYIGKGGKVSIPAKLGGKTVTVVGLGSFRWKQKVTSVKFPKTVRKIESRAFDGCSIKSVKFSKGLKSIGFYGFGDCDEIKTIKLPNTVTKLGEGAFSDCEKLKNLTLSKNITEIPDDCFSCTALTEFKTPAACKRVGNAFYESKVKTFVAGKNVEKLSANTFYAAVHLTKIKVSKNNKYFTAKDGVLYNKKMTKLILYPNRKKGTEFTVPSSVKTIGKNAFGDFFCWRSPEKVNLQNGIKKISENAFYHAEKLSEINFPSTVEYIGKGAFEDTGLKAIDIPKSVKYIGDEAFDYTKAETITVTPNPELEIGKNVFASNYKLKKVTYFQAKKSDGYAFASCGKLSELVIPDAVTGIFERDFYGCPSLVSVTVPDSVTKIDNYALGFTAEYDDDEDYPSTVKLDEFTLRGGKDSAAEKYALAHEIHFEEVQ